LLWLCRLLSLFRHRLRLQYKFVQQQQRQTGAAAAVTPVVTVQQLLPRRLLQLHLFPASSQSYR